jgi:recombination protein RecT
MGTEVNTVQNKLTIYKERLTERKNDFIAMLPRDVDFEAFKQILITVAIKNPALLNAEQESLFMAIRQCAQDGLLPDGRESALVIFKTKKDNQFVDAVSYMPMIAGIYKKLRNSGKILSIVARVIHKNDAFDYELGDNEFINHKPAFDNRGEAIGVYGIIKTTDGAVHREVMNKQEVEYIRQFSKSEQNKKKYPNTVTIWDSHWGEMAKKTVIRRLVKPLPMTKELTDFFNRDNENYIDIKDAVDIQATKPSTMELLDKQLAQQNAVFVDITDAVIEPDDIQNEINQQGKTR